MSQMIGPGEDATVRLVMSMQVDTGSTMELGTGDAAAVLYVEFESRSLGDVDERENRTYVMASAQAAFLAGQLMGELGKRSG